MLVRGSHSCHITGEPHHTLGFVVHTFYGAGKTDKTYVQAVCTAMRPWACHLFYLRLFPYLREHLRIDTVNVMIK